MRRLPTPELFDEANQQSAGYQSGRLAALAVSLIPRDRDALRLLETCRLWPAVVFEKLPEDWVCPECAEGKEQFIEA